MKPDQIHGLLNQSYRIAGNKLILLDYDGTISELTSDPTKAMPTSEVIQLLTKLSGNINTQLAIVTGRSTHSMDTFFADQSFTIFAEHGVMLKQKNHWECLINGSTEWMSEVYEAMQSIASQCKHSFVEEKQFTVAWHFRQSNEEEGIKFSNQLNSILKKLCAKFKFKITNGHKIVEVTSIEVSKSIAVKHLLNSSQYDFILCIGDDRTDEEMFCALSDNPYAATIKVGKGETAAKYRLDSVSNVLHLLEQLSI